MSLFFHGCLLILGLASAQGLTAVDLGVRELGIASFSQDIQAPATIAGEAFILSSSQEDRISKRYRHGAEVVKLYGPKDTFSRIIAVKLCTIRKDGYLLDMLCIYDITEPDDVFHQQFSPVNELEKTFALDDRTPGKREYVLKIDYSGDDCFITLGRPGNEEQIRTTIRRLRRLRAQQVLVDGTRVEINGKKFLVLLQSAGVNSFLYFNGDLKDKMKMEDFSVLEPELLADLPAYKYDGSIPEPSPLGRIGDRYYFLVFDPQTNYWIPTPGDPP